MATPYFYQQLRKIALEEGIPFIVDETRTGVGATGKYWGHEHWYLEVPADFVTFGGNSQVSGYYSTPDFRPFELHKNTALDNGSMMGLNKLKIINDVI